MKLKALFQSTYVQLKEIGIDNPHLETSWLIEKFCSITDIYRIQNPDAEIAESHIQVLNQAIERRNTGEPLAYILGERDFYGLTFLVNKNVLIPRPETEIIVDWSIDWAQKRNNQNINIADLGTGSGCIGISLLKHLAHANLVAVDISNDALNVAQENAIKHGVSNRSRYFNEDVLDLFKRWDQSTHLNILNFDLIVANPPYIEIMDSQVEENVKKFEPSLALFSAERGLHHIKSWMRIAHPFLSSGGAMVFEIGASQGDEVIKFMKDLNIFSSQFLIKDLNKLDRVVVGIK